tara:strand:+ start:284 stop:634 length:351 start_codon:yes stop_codon:yes gene_type:complete
MNLKTLLWSEDTPSRLLASYHRSTGEIVFPPIPSHSPLADNYVSQVLESEGTVYSYTIIHPSLKSGLQPFTLVYLDLPGPTRLFGRVNSIHRLAVGDLCRVIPDDTYGYAFEFMED